MSVADCSHVFDEDGDCIRCGADMFAEHRPGRCSCYRGADADVLAFPPAAESPEPGKAGT